MVKKAPSEEQLKETVRSLLKEANLEEMTMKQICQRVRAAVRRRLVSFSPTIYRSSVNVCLFVCDCWLKKSQVN